MILSALKYLISLSTPEPVKVGDYMFSDRELKIIEVPKIETVEVTTTLGFVQFVNASKSKRDQFIHMGSESVRLMSKALSYSYRRECYCELKLKNNFNMNDLENLIRNEIKGILIIV